MEKEQSEKVHALELENARLQGRLEGGGGQQQAQPFAFDSVKEYQLAGRNLQLMAQGLEQDDPRMAQLQQNSAAMDADYNRFLGHQNQQQQQEQQRKIDRAGFYAARQIDPESEIARYVEVLHENEVPFEHIEHQILSPRQQLAELQRRGGHGAAMTAATQIEGGTQRQSAPAPLGQQQLNPEQFASNDLVRRMQNRNPDTETQLFGDNEFLE